MVWNKPDTTDAHVCVVQQDIDDSALTTGDYGQPGGCMNTRSLTPSLNGWKLGNRTIRMHLRLHDVLLSARQEHLIELPRHALIDAFEAANA